MPEGREWRPGKPGEFDELLKEMLEEAIEAQRNVTGYKGEAEGFQEYVGNIEWNFQKYQHIGFNSGFIAACLNVVENMKAKLPDILVKTAPFYIYGES